MNMKKEGYLGGSDGKKSACSVGNLGSLDWEDPLDEGMATIPVFFVWRIPMDRGAWPARVNGVAESRI